MQERKNETRRSGVFQMPVMHIQDYVDLVDQLLDNTNFTPPRTQRTNSQS